jgi:predicted secreted protein
MQTTARAFSHLLLATAIVVGMSTYSSQSALGCSTRTVKAGLKTSGKKITVHRGRKIRLVLSSNPTTGYSWKINGKVPKGISLIGRMRYSPYSSKPDKPGSGGVQSWVFKARSHRTVKVRLKYWRSFEPTATPAAKFTLTVKIR